MMFPKFYSKMFRLMIIIGFLKGGLSQIADVQITATTNRNPIVGQPLNINCALNVTLSNITINAGLRLKEDGMPFHYWNVHISGTSFTKPTSVVTWRNHTINVLNTNHDGKTYQCEGIINTVPLLDIASSLFLKVTVPPPTITVTRSRTPIVGQSLGLNCMVNTVSGITSIISVVWTSCGKILYSTSITQGTSNIRYTILQLSTADEGKVYQCEVVINTIPPVRAIGLITLNVNIPSPTVIIIVPNTQTVGQSLTMQCKVTPVRGITSSVDVVWSLSHGGTALKRTTGVIGYSSSVFTDSYTIPQLSSEDHGKTYWCEATISSSRHSNSVTLNVNAPVRTVDVTTSSAIIVGQPLILECTMTTVTDITGRVDIVWSTGNNELQRSTAVSVASVTSNSAVYKDSYVITQLTTSHHGRVYQCKVVINARLSSIDATGNFMVHVTIPLPSINVNSLSSQQVGKPLTLYCHAATVRGIESEVDIVWTSNNTIIRKMSSINPTNMSTSQIYTDSYTISQLSTEDNGKVYQCQVIINSASIVTATSNIALDVIVPILTVNVKAPDKVIVKEAVDMECNVITVRGVNSRVDVVWSFNGTEVERVEAISINHTTNSSTVYSHVYEVNTTESGGAYQCEAIININPPVKATGSVVIMAVVGLQTDQNTSNIFVILFISSAGGSMLIAALIVVYIVMKKTLMNLSSKIKNSQQCNNNMSNNGEETEGSLSTERSSAELAKKSSPGQKSSPTKQKFIRKFKNASPPAERSLPNKGALVFSPTEGSSINENQDDEVVFGTIRFDSNEPPLPAKPAIIIQDNPAYGTIN